MGIISDQIGPSIAAAIALGGLAGDIKSALDRTSASDSNDNQSNTTTPPVSKLFSDGVADAYERFIRTKKVGGLMPASPTGISALKASLKTHKFSGWGLAFSTYWTAIVWTPAGNHTTAVLLNAAPMGQALQAELDSLITSEFTPEANKTGLDFANRIAGILSTYTAKLQAQVTLSNPPWTATELVS